VRLVGEAGGRLGTTGRSSKKLDISPSALENFKQEYSMILFQILKRSPYYFVDDGLKVEIKDYIPSFK
jgi:hypothetical protein